jgi:voltage-gated potassium channel
VSPFVRLRIAIGLVLATGMIGTAGFMLIERWSFMDALYMTAITLATIGYGEVRPLDTAGRLFDIGLIVVGVTSGAYAFGTIAELLIEQHVFQDAVRERRMTHEINRLSHHVIVCGYGRVGMNVVAELRRMGRPFVVLEQSPERVRQCHQHGYLAIAGDATQDGVLLRAGVERADAVVTALESDAANLYITLSCRSLRADLFIVSRASDETAEPKLLRAGANRVLCPYSLTGRLLAEMVVKPEVAEIVEFASADSHLDLHLEEVAVAPDSPLVGRTIGDPTIRTMTGATIVAVRDRAAIVPNPPPETAMEAGVTLLVIGTREQVRRFHVFAEEHAALAEPHEGSRPVV